jgi:hypothetical protein
MPDWRQSQKHLRLWGALKSGRWVLGVPLGMRNNPEYFNSADRPVVTTDIFAREDPDDEEEEDEDEDEDEGEDTDEDEEEDEGYSE